MCTCISVYIYIYVSPKKDTTSAVHKGVGLDGMGLGLSTRGLGFRGKIKGFSEFAVSPEVGILDVVFTLVPKYPCLLG